MNQHEWTVRKNRRRRLCILLALFLIVAVLLGVFIYSACRYNAADFSLIRTEEAHYEILDGFFYPKGDEIYRASYNADTGVLHRYPAETLSLSEFGLSGSYDYFRYRPQGTNEGGRIVPCEMEMLPLSRANTDRYFVYTEQETQNRYLVDMSGRTAKPLFADSAEGVDIYGTKITCFSHRGGLRAAGADGQTLLLYRRGDSESFAVSSFDIVDMRPYCVSFDCYFINEQYLQIIGTNSAQNTVYYLCDALTGKITPCPRKSGAVYDDNSAICTPYSQGFLREVISAENQPEDAFLLRYINLSDGAEFSLSFAKDTAHAELLAVSPTGAYCLVETTSDAARTLSICSAKKQRALAPCLPDGAAFDSLVFAADNVIVIHVTMPNGAQSALFYKICD